MNINIDSIHSEELRLQQLANFLFNQHAPAVQPAQQQFPGSATALRIPDQGNEVNLKAPQTSLPDPHFPARGSSLPSFKDAVSFSQLPISDYAQHHTPYYFLKDREASSNLQPSDIQINSIRQQFPILQQYVNGRPLIWLDNAATTQKPKHVIDRITQFYQTENSNIHRGAHQLAARATDAYEAAREKVRSFLKAGSVNEIIFVRGTTEGINLIAKTFGEGWLKEGDQVLISHLEHHANIVPWQQLRASKGIELKVIPVDESGQIDLDKYRQLLGPKVKLVSFTHVSNALGTITPAKQMIALAHQAGAKVLLDGAQSVSHMPVNLQDLQPDFFVFSGHKIFAPTGIGVVYIREELLESIPAWQGGGNMIKDVTFEHTEYQPGNARFEAGTGNIADAVGLGAAIDFLEGIGMPFIESYEHQLLQYAIGKLKQVPGLALIGTAKAKASVLSFTLDGYSNDAVGKHFDRAGIAVRTGHHCAQPILRRFGLESTVRPSLAFYNTIAEIDELVNQLFHLVGKR